MRKAILIPLVIAIIVGTYFGFTNYLKKQTEGKRAVRKLKESWRIDDSLKSADYQKWQQDSINSSNVYRKKLDSILVARGEEQRHYLEK